MLVQDIVKDLDDLNTVWVPYHWIFFSLWLEKGI